LTEAYSRDAKAANTPGRRFPSATPATMQRATQSESQRSNRVMRSPFRIPKGSPFPSGRKGSREGGQGPIERRARSVAGPRLADMQRFGAESAQVSAFHAKQNASIV